MPTPSKGLIRKPGTRPPNLVRLAVFVDVDLRTRAKIAAADANLTMEIWVAAAVSEKLARQFAQRSRLEDLIAS